MQKVAVNFKKGVNKRSYPDSTRTAFCVKWKMMGAIEDITTNDRHLSSADQSDLRKCQLDARTRLHLTGKTAPDLEGVQVELSCLLREIDENISDVVPHLDDAFLKAQNFNDLLERIKEVVIREIGIRRGDNALPPVLRAALMEYVVLREYTKRHLCKVFSHSAVDLLVNIVEVLTLECVRRYYHIHPTSLSSGIRNIGSLVQLSPPKVISSLLVMGVIVLGLKFLWKRL